MKSRTLHRKLNILKLLYDTTLRLTAAQFKISNANQYLIALEEAKLIKRIEVPREGTTPYKIGFVDSATRKKAKEYLVKHSFLNVATPLHIVSFEDETQG